MAPGGLAHRVQRTTSSPAAAAKTTTTTTTATHSWPPAPTTSASARSWGRRRRLRRRQRRSLTGTYVRKTKMHTRRKEVSFRQVVPVQSITRPEEKLPFFSSALRPSLRPLRPRPPTPLRLPSLSPRRKSTLSSRRPRLRPRRPRRQRPRPTSSWTASTRSRTTLVSKRDEMN